MFSFESALAFFIPLGIIIVVFTLIIVVIGVVISIIEKLIRGE